MQSQLFDYGSLRARKARFGRIIARPLVRAVLGVAAILSIAGLVWMIWSGIPAGWLLLAPLGPIVTLLCWYQYDARQLAPLTAETIDARLEGSVLGLLPADVTPRRLAQIVSSTRGGYFYTVRFGVGSQTLSLITSEDPKDMDLVWRTALEIQQRLQSDTLHAEALVAALIVTCPGIDPVLAQIHIDKGDILQGVDWQEHIFAVSKKHAQASKSGGFGRDWSFGYTPLLSRLGINISEQIEHSGLLVREIEGHSQVLDQMLEALMSGHRNVALVGPLGVGKSTLVDALADRLLKSNAPPPLRYHQIVRLDASTLISRAQGRGQLEELLPELFHEAHSAKNIIICLDDAELFLEEGIGSVDLTNILQPIIDGGVLKMVITIDEQRLLQIGQRNPAIVRSLNTVTVAPPEKRDVLHILQDQLILLEYQNKVTYTYQSLHESYRLAERYIHTQAMPGRALNLLEAAARQHDNGLVTAESVQKAIEASQGIKVALASSDEERQTLLDLESKIHERMINQSRAVAVVSDALRRARSGVRNQDRPIGTFLFLGPTGVGKTELAKSLAAVFFNGEDNLIRLDLNEFNQPSDVSRLIASAADDGNSLTAQVRKKPFSVVLLDEIEKASPEVLNTLLQLLDEGILRDSTNQETSFRDAVVIATSNAGADQIRAHIEAGESLEQFEAGFIDELINSNIFRPEFLNRFDETVLFRPLNQEELLQVVDLILAGINKNLALQKVAVHVSDDAKRMLVAHGYDPRLGARPMRRVVQRSVENLLSRAMLAGELPAGSTMEVTLQQVQAILGESTTGSNQ